MSRNIFEQIQTALTPLPYLVFKRANGEEVLMRLTAIISATKHEGIIVLTLENQKTIELMAVDMEEFSAKLQEGIDLAVQRNAQEQLNALLATGKLIS